MNRAGWNTVILTVHIFSELTVLMHCSCRYEHALWWITLPSNAIGTKVLWRALWQTDENILASWFVWLFWAGNVIWREIGMYRKLFLTYLCHSLLHKATASSQTIWLRLLFYSKALVEQHQQVPFDDILVDRYWRLSCFGAPHPCWHVSQWSGREYCYLNKSDWQ